MGERLGVVCGLVEREGGEEWMRAGEDGCGTAPLAAPVEAKLSLREKLGWC